MSDAIHKTPQDAYEEFRSNYEGSPGEKPLRPWTQLTEKEKDFWTDQFNRYHEIGGTDHGDPEIIQKQRPHVLKHIPGTGMPEE